MWSMIGAVVSTATLVLIVAEFYGKKKVDERPHAKSVVYIDTSGIIDHRLERLLAAGFMQTPLIVPDFVAQELQSLADKGTKSKRDKGRAGLAKLKALTTDGHLTITKSQLLEGEQVDDALVRMAQSHNSSLYTLDFNLSSIAHAKGVTVINPQELKVALREQYSVGQVVVVEILHKGTESKQGVGYGVDGAMFVVVGAAGYVGKSKKVVIDRVQIRESGTVLFAHLQR